jgi:hypothetical protein
MYKSYFHNDKLINENEDKTKIHQKYNPNIKKIVDINILLNKVKLEKRSEIKKKIIFISSVTASLILFGTFIVAI